MTKKKLAIVVGGALAGLLLLVALFVGAVAGVAFYGLANSDAATAAEAFLRDNQKLKNEIGEVKDFGTFVTGSVDGGRSEGGALLHLKVNGARRTVNVDVSLVFKQGHGWRVTGASFRGEDGRTVELLEKYEHDDAEDVPSQH